MSNSLFVILFLLIAKNEICESSNNEVINRLVTHGEWSNIHIPQGVPNFEHIIINHDVRKFNLLVKIYHAQLPCEYRARLYVHYTSSNGKPAHLGPFCDILNLQPIISYNDHVRLYIVGYVQVRHLNIGVYEKLLPATTFPITTTTPTTATTTPTTTTVTSTTTTTTPTTTSTLTSTSTTTPTTTSTSTTSTSTLTTTTPTTTSSTTTVVPSICGKELEANAGNIRFSRPPNWIPDCSTCSMTLKIPSSQKATALRFQSFQFSTKDFDCVNSTVIIKSDEGIKFFCSDSPPEIGERILFRSNLIQIQTSIKWKDSTDYESGFDVKFFGAPEDSVL